jgi:hypothetical protein
MAPGVPPTYRALMRRIALLAAALGAAAGLGGSRGGESAARSVAMPAAATARAAQAAAPVRRPDRARYELDLAYDARRFALEGTERIAFTNTGTTPLAAVWVRVWANAFGGCRAARAQVTVTAGGALAARRRDCTALEVRLDQPLGPGAAGAIALRIRITAPRRADRFGRYRGAAYFGNALPILAVAEDDGYELPPYAFAGESFYSLTSAWQVRLRLPAGVRAASTGTQAGPSRGGVVTLVAPRARDFAIVAGRFAVRTARAGPVRLRRFSIPGTPAAQARRTLRIAALGMRRYAAWYGPYARP